MAFLLDTNVAIHLRDGDLVVGQRLAALGPDHYLSIVSRVELENGVYAEPEASELRRRALDRMLEQIETLDFGVEELGAYANLVATIGYSRRKTTDRMIAATALVHDLTLITFNGRDFRDVRGLQVEAWKCLDRSQYGVNP